MILSTDSAVLQSDFSGATQITLLSLISDHLRRPFKLLKAECHNFQLLPLIYCTFLSKSGFLDVPHIIMQLPLDRLATSLRHLHL